jgi:hypothetical protein
MRGVFTLAPKAAVAVGEGPPRNHDQIGAKDLTQHLDGEKEAIAGLDPLLVSRGRAAGWDHAKVKCLNRILRTPPSEDCDV